MLLQAAAIAAFPGNQRDRAITENNKPFVLKRYGQLHGTFNPNAVELSNNGQTGGSRFFFSIAKFFNKKTGQILANTFVISVLRDFTSQVVLRFTVHYMMAGSVNHLDFLVQGLGTPNGKVLSTGKKVFHTNRIRCFNELSL